MPTNCIKCFEISISSLTRVLLLIRLLRLYRFLSSILKIGDFTKLVLLSPFTLYQQKAPRYYLKFFKCFVVSNILFLIFLGTVSFFLVWNNNIFFPFFLTTEILVSLFYFFFLWRIYNFEKNYSKWISNPRAT